MKPVEIFIGPCSKWVDGLGWVTEIPIQQLKEKGYIKQMDNKKQEEVNSENT